MSSVLGIHHITAMAGAPQENIDFYTRTLGLRLVKRTVNFDDPYTYHFYFGNESGEPGTILTFFPWGASSLRGRHGTGQVEGSAFSIPAGSSNFWIERLASRDVVFDGPEARFGETVITVRDTDGVVLELVESSDARPGWANGEIPLEHSIRGFHHATLSLEGYERTSELLGVLGFTKHSEAGNRFRFVCGDGAPGKIIDLLCEPDRMRGTMGVGVVHHIAFRAANDREQIALRDTLRDAGSDVTPVIDRQYFQSIYFREPGGVLFEIATDPPGFAIDEPKEHLGERLVLPRQYESQRPTLERTLPRLTLPVARSKAAR